ncbi:hypothetical protein M501DRAFT_836061 [Patellaria atrata CBS 101060]|uniref:Uncharacterized protein n=1 Tax=Patellaria atrata CBS 101060 TaxID=1346257 RepID=A0A9P4S9Z0_9PEZI|nr:hypothetical protein M501DRAFT_836061 [Patellaria atrata CBS 101060]
MYFEIEKLLLDLTDCLTPTETRSKVGPFTQSQLFSSAEELLGPFKSSRDAYISMFQRQLDLIATNQFKSLQVDDYLTFKWRLEMADAVTSSIS